MFRPMWPSLDVKIIGRGNCCLLLLLMLFMLYICPLRCAHVFEVVGCILSCCVLLCCPVFEWKSRSTTHKQQKFPRPIILTPDDDHIGRNI
jgi:hypothetical protein